MTSLRQLLAMLHENRPAAIIAHRPLILVIGQEPPIDVPSDILRADGGGLGVGTGIGGGLPRHPQSAPSASRRSGAPASLQPALSAQRLHELLLELAGGSPGLSVQVAGRVNDKSRADRALKIVRKRLTVEQLVRGKIGWIRGRKLAALRRK